MLDVWAMISAYTYGEDMVSTRCKINLASGTRVRFPTSPPIRRYNMKNRNSKRWRAEETHSKNRRKPANVKGKNT